MPRAFKALASAALFVGVALFPVSLHGAPIRFTGMLSPEAVGATGTGHVLLEFDTVEHELFIDVSWTGLSGVTSVAHIHCCTTVPETGTVGVAVTPGTLPGFPVGLSSGRYSILLDMTLPENYTAGYLAGPGGGTPLNGEAALIAALMDGRAYFNIHSNLFPAGEIRSFPSPVPEPSTLVLTSLAMAGLAARRRR